MTKLRLHNHSPYPFSGWKRLTCDAPLAPSYVSPNGEVTVIRGRQTGLDVFAVDVKCHLDPGASTEVDLSTMAAGVPQDLPLPDPAWFGGSLHINGAELPPPTVQADGAAWVSHSRGRVHDAPAFVVDVWIRWYPGESWAHAEVMITHSNPTLLELRVNAPNISISFGSAVALAMGNAGSLLVAEGTPFGDGQARILPIVFLWPGKMLPGDQESAFAASTLHVCGVGIEKLLHHGNPIYPDGFDPLAWMRAGRVAASIVRANTWDVGIVGPNKTSGDTGAQEDQVFVRGEALLLGGVGAELIAYLGALKMANRPCHHREADGSPLNPALHTGRPLIFWDGRPHGGLWGIVDRLGKSVQMTPAQAEGWWGPDVEHWLMNTLAAASRLTGSPALQELLCAQATLYPLQWTTTPGWSTTQPYASRAVGYEAINAVHLWRELADRDLAARVADHWMRRWNLVIRVAPDYAQWDIVDARRDDPRLGTGDWWMPWQQAICSYGLDLAGEVFNVPAARQKAYDLALRVVEDAFYQESAIGFWRSYKSLALDGRKDLDNIYFYFGLPMAPAVVLRHDPNNGRARAIWGQQRTASQMTQTSWCPPGVP